MMPELQNRQKSAEETDLDAQEPNPLFLLIVAFQAERDDVGEIPGDHLGAAGLDSSINSYLKRNWTWNARTRIKTGNRTKPSEQAESPLASAALTTSHPKSPAKTPK